MKLLKYLILLCILIFFGAVNSNAQANKYNKWSFELSYGLEFYSDKYSDFRDKGDEYSIKLETYQVNYFGFYASVSYAKPEDYVYPYYYVHSPNTEGTIKTSYTSFNLGANWYILDSKCTRKFTPFIGAEISSSIYHFQRVTDDKMYKSHNFEDKDNAAYFSPTVGLNIPLIDSFVFRGTFKYTIPLFYLERFNDWDPKSEDNYGEQYSVNFGLMFTF